MKQRKNKLWTVWAMKRKGKRTELFKGEGIRVWICVFSILPLILLQSPIIFWAHFVYGPSYFPWGLVERVLLFACGAPWVSHAPFDISKENYFWCPTLFGVRPMKLENYSHPWMGNLVISVENYFWCPTLTKSNIFIFFSFLYHLFFKVRII
jgi:hypothetical protein